MFLHTRSMGLNWFFYVFIIHNVINNRLVCARAHVPIVCACSCHICLHLVASFGRLQHKQFSPHSIYVCSLISLTSTPRGSFIA